MPGPTYVDPWPVGTQSPFASTDRPIGLGMTAASTEELEWAPPMAGVFRDDREKAHRDNEVEESDEEYGEPEEIDDLQ